MGEHKESYKKIALGFTLSLTMLIAGCENKGGVFTGKGESNGLFSNKKRSTTPPIKDGTIKLVERDVESPESFQVTEEAMWDGRPSLGGVWVAHADSKQPERVIIRNNANGKFVIGALFKREQAFSGPKLQLSSDAAAALKVQAGIPVTLNVTALRRETINSGETELQTTNAPTPANDIESTALDAIANTASEQTASTTISSTPQASALSQPYIQLGFFSVEKNARNTLKALETRNIPGKVVKATAKGKSFWRVLAGPAQNRGERDMYMNTIRDMGFDDAYLTKN